MLRLAQTGLFILWALCLNAQLLDDFSDGDFTQNPPWYGDTDHFIINDQQQLRLNGPAQTDTAYLQTASSMMDSTEWRFYVKLDFSPSSNNLVRIYLTSDAPDLKGALNGYFIRVGESGNDDPIQLYRQTGFNQDLILQGNEVGGKSVNTLRIKVLRDNIGNWEVYVDTLGGANFQYQGTTFDDSLTTTQYLGLYCKYTSTRSDKFFFDDFYVGDYLVDTIPPNVESVEVVDDQSVDVVFSEGVEKSTAENTAYYTVNSDVGTPATAQRDDIQQHRVRLTFNTPFAQATTYTLSVDGVKDYVGNAVTNVTHDFVYYLPQAYDIVINELFAITEPQVGLPRHQFVELYNSSDFTLSLEGWTLRDRVTTTTLPDIKLPPDSLLILCAHDARSAYSGYGAVAGLSSWPSLNITNEDLVLRDNRGHLMHNVSYTRDWYQDALKEGGGWSLEMQDPGNPCAGITNWRASEDAQGGTPGAVNSIYAPNPDTVAPKLLRAFPVTPDTLLLFFNEPLDSAASVNIGFYKIDQNIGYPAQVTGIPINFEQVKLALDNPLETDRTYTLTVKGPADCAGNMMTPSNVKVAIPEPMDSLDIVINEVLFNAPEGGEKFVELYNRSGKVLNLGRLNLANADPAVGIVKDVHAISETGFLLFPGEYVAFTTDRQAVLNHYETPNPEGVIQLDKLPSYPIQEGMVILLHQTNHRIDALAYNEDMHFDLIADPKGVSLERIQPNHPTQDPNNWHSAASTADYGTPAYENSQYHPVDQQQGEITLEPEVFSPDGDGYKDLLHILYQFERPGMVARISVHDATGRHIRQIANNELLNPSGSFTWDGTNDEGQKARMGIYMIFFEAYAPEGEVVKLKGHCVLSGSFD